MKKIICLLLSLSMVMACCTVVFGAADKQVTFSPSKVQGKKGDLVFVDISLLEENSEIGALELQLAYDTQKLKMVVHPESEKEKPYVPKDVILESGSSLHDFGEKRMLFVMVSGNGYVISGPVCQFAFELLEDVPEPTPLVACRVTAIAHKDEDWFRYDISYVNNWENAVFLPLDPDAMLGNQVTFYLTDIAGTEKGEKIAVSFGLSQSYTYIKEFAIQLSFDTKMLQLSDENIRGTVFVPSKPMAQENAVTFDQETNILQVSLKEGLETKMNFGYFSFKVIGDVTQTDVMPITFEFVKDPIHATDETFEYETVIQNGRVTIHPPSFVYEETENGLMLVKYQGNKSSVSIPTMVDGKFVTAIGANAFTHCDSLEHISITNYITHIEQGAFGNGVSFSCGENSAAQAYAKEHDIPYTILHSLADAVTSTDVWAQGDLNRDGYINAKDGLITLRYSVGKVEFAPGQLVAANVNKDDVINAKDALEMLKRSVGKKACF